MLVKRKNFTRLNSKFNKRSKRSKRSKQNKINRKSRKNRKLKGGRSKGKKDKFTIKRGGAASGASVAAASVAAASREKSLYELLSRSLPGSYFIRESSSGSHIKTLEVKFPSEVCKYRIYRNEGGDLDNEGNFYINNHKSLGFVYKDKIDGLIEHYKENHLFNTPRGTIKQILTINIEEFEYWKRGHQYQDTYSKFILYDYKDFADKIKEPCLLGGIDEKDIRHRKKWLHVLNKEVRNMKDASTQDRKNFVHACIETLTQNKSEECYIIFIRNRDTHNTKGIRDLDTQVIGDIEYRLSGSITIYQKKKEGELVFIKDVKIGNTIDFNQSTEQVVSCIWVNKVREWAMHGIPETKQNLSHHIQHLLYTKLKIEQETPIYIVLKE
jgi:hypothetical protein